MRFANEFFQRERRPSDEVGLLDDDHTTIILDVRTSSSSRRKVV